MFLFLQKIACFLGDSYPLGCFISLLFASSLPFLSIVRVCFFFVTINLRRFRYTSAQFSRLTDSYALVLKIIVFCNRLLYITECTTKVLDSCLYLLSDNLYIALIFSINSTLLRIITMRTQGSISLFKDSLIFLIGHFRVALSFCFKARLSAKTLI